MKAIDLLSKYIWLFQSVITRLIGIDPPYFVAVHRYVEPCFFLGAIRLRPSSNGQLTNAAGIKKFVPVLCHLKIRGLYT